MDDREVRLVPHDMQWAAFFPDTPHQRCIGDSAQDALGRLREIARLREEELARERQSEQVTRRKRTAAIVGSVLMVGLLATAFIVKSTANSVQPRAHAKIYAHHATHKSVKSHRNVRHHLAR